jgi:hypothetical protein
MRTAVAMLAGLAAASASNGAGTPAKGSAVAEDKGKGKGCPWEELLPRVTATATECPRVYRPRAPLLANEPAAFLLVAPSEARCGKHLKKTHSLPDCPDAPLPLPTEDTATDQSLRPHAFFKVSLAGPRSFAHAVDMAPAAADTHAFTMVPVEATKEANLTLRMDFSGCEGRDMLGAWVRGCVGCGKSRALGTVLSTKEAGCGCCVGVGVAYAHPILSFTPFCRLGCTGLNPVDFAVFESPAADTKALHWDSPEDSSFRGCRSSPFKEVATWTGIHIMDNPVAAGDADGLQPGVLASPGMSPANSVGHHCDWSLLRGGWHLDSLGLPQRFSSPCRPRRNPGPGIASTALDAPRRGGVTASRGLSLGRFCVIGDSNQKNWWKQSYLPVATELGIIGRPGTNSSAFLSGGGIEMDIAKYAIRFTSSEAGTSIIPVDQPYFDQKNNPTANSIKKGAPGNRKYSLAELQRTGQTRGLVQAILAHDHNPWDGVGGCLHTREIAGRQSALPPALASLNAGSNPVLGKPDAVLFHAGSHNCGTSAAEASEAVRLLVAMFLAWRDSTGAALPLAGDGTADGTGRAKCLVIVSTPDMHHEGIKVVDKGKFGDQAHFRNSFRIASANAAMRRAVADARASHSDRKQGLNVHFLDTFHLSLGLHWSGHDVGAMQDPVHFRPEGINREFAEVLFEAATEMCAQGG